MESFTIEFEADSEGYFTYECPFCEEQFKLLAPEVQDEDFELEINTETLKTVQPKDR